MARTTKSVKNDPINYKEFDIMASNKNNFTGRVYTERKDFEKGAAYGVSITINDVTIKGVKLWVPKDEDKDCSFMWPSYKDSKGNYNNYVDFFNQEIAADVTEVANKLAEMLA